MFFFCCRNKSALADRCERATAAIRATDTGLFLHPWIVFFIHDFNWFRCGVATFLISFGSFLSCIMLISRLGVAQECLTIDATCDRMPFDFFTKKYYNPYGATIQKMKCNLLGFKSRSVKDLVAKYKYNYKLYRAGMMDKSELLKNYSIMKDCMVPVSKSDSSICSYTNYRYSDITTEVDPWYRYT